MRKYRMIRPGDRIVLGVSGGPDSMALLYLMCDLREDFGCILHVAHLDHMLRGQESEADAAYVAEHSRKLGIPITIEAIDVRRMITRKESLESGARRIRYEFYERVMADIRADKVAQGHNADDQAETVMMRLLRGSGLQGLSGIPPVRDGRFIRPLIEATRSDIDEYLQHLQLKPRQDSSNLSREYERNRVRHELMPLLERDYSPNIKQILRQTGEILRAEDDLLAALTEDAMESCVQYPDARTAVIRIPDLSGYHLALQRRILRLTIEKLAGDLRRYDYDHIRDLLDFALCGMTGKTIDLPRGISAEKTYDVVVLRYGYRPGVSIGEFDYRVKVPGETKITHLSLLIRTDGPQKVCEGYGKLQSDEDEFRATLDYDKIRGHLHLRNRRPGDRFQPLGMSGTKKLKDFFVDEKIPRALRDSVPILMDEGNILWVIGYRIDDRFKITPDTRTQLTVRAIPDRGSDRPC